jgi:hypothetical protein
MAHKDGMRAGAQGSPTSKVFGGGGKIHNGGSSSKLTASPGVLNGSGDQYGLKSPKTPASNFSKSSYKSGYGVPSASQRRSGG